MDGFGRLEGRVDVRISCIIPTLGRGRVLCDTIEMLRAQTCRAHEIVVVDQTPVVDSITEEALRKWDDAKEIRWIRQTDPNASKARNVGAAVATGEVLLLLDDDIVIGRQFIQSYVDAFQRTGAMAVAGQILEHGAKPVDVMSEKAFDPVNGWLYFRKNYARECETCFMMSGNVAIRREVYFAVGGMDENYEKGAHREETDFAIRFCKAGYRLHFSPQCSILHLGQALVRDGGTRTWARGRDFRYFHHCVGDWYFNLAWVTPGNCRALFWGSLRHFVLTHQSRDRPWRIPLALGYWLAALPTAALRRWRGPKLVFRAGLETVPGDAPRVFPTVT